MAEKFNKYKIPGNKAYQVIRILLTVIVWGVTQSGAAQSENYLEFDNVNLNYDASVVNCFMQDGQGLIWMGTDKGLFSYNGHSVQQHLPFSKDKKDKVESISMINCGLLLNSNQLCLGADNGLFFYNLKTDQYESRSAGFPSDIRSLALSDKDLWIGTLNGLYRYDMNADKIENISLRKNSGIPHKAIYSILRASDHTLYIGTYNGLCFLDNQTQIFHKIDLPVRLPKNNLLVNSLLEDPVSHSIWIGTEGYLFRFFPKTRTMEHLEQFDGNSIKSLALDQNKNLLLGTDNGLYVFNDLRKEVKHIVHDSRYGQSLSNNIIWGIFIDRQKNAWFGTDYGVSLVRSNKEYRYIPISKITHVGDGNNLQVIFRDSRNNFWYGGTNGLIYSPADGSGSIWYKMGDARYPISHNRIRCVYEDRSHNLWVATDGSINRFDYRTHQFIHYNIVDKSRTRNANWAYNIFEDKQNRLWIATCLGGVFAVDKQKLLASAGQTYIAEQNFYKNDRPDGLSDNFINQVLMDLQGNVWALTYNAGFNKIESKSGRVTHFNVKANEPGRNASCMISDREGYIWLGFYGGLNRLNPRTNELQAINFSGFKDVFIRILTEENNHIWVTTSDGTFVLDKKTLQVRATDLLNKPFACSYYNASSRQIYLGGVDGYLEFSPSIANARSALPAITLTALYVNDRLFLPGRDYRGKSIRYANEISLKYDQNNISLEFSDLNFSREKSKNYLYRLEGVDEDWRTTKNLIDKINYTNLSPGKYKLHFGRLTAEGKVVTAPLDFQLIIIPPWYLTVWAKLFYVLMVIGFIVWCINYYHIRHRIKIERIEKEKSLELSRMKIDFFTHVSHEFKTPLSLIIAPVSKLLSETRQPLLKKQLELIQQNALRLNALIQQVIGFERFDGSADATLIASKVEFIEFARGIFSVFEEAFQTRGLNARFVPAMETVWVKIDVLKMESVLNNLISNACKFTREGGEVIFEIRYSESQANALQLTIIDNGIGIPKEDLPFVFDRFFQSRKTVNDKEGSGIGLYLVKNYVELHSGTISIASEEDRGTTLTITLPVVDTEAAEAYQTTAAETAKEKVTDENRPLILIVEDNTEISEFIAQSLSAEYRYELAHNGKTGLDMAVKIKPDLIIADVMMPVMNGLDMCRLLRKHHDLTSAPIIMLTAKDDKTTEEQSLQLGINAFVSKPFDPKMLLLRIRQLLGVQQQIENKVRLEVIATPKEIEAESWDEKLLNDITRIIEDHVDDPDLNVNQLCEYSGLSSKQIYRKIKQLTGLTPVDYIRSIRMKKAAMLLSQKKFSVAEVMYLVGFSNYSYFSKCFQAKYGKTPKQFMD